MLFRSLLLAGEITIAEGGIWDTPNGDGYFSPKLDTLSPYYIFGEGDTARGNVKLVLTSTGNGGCVARHDTLDVSIQPLITVKASSDDSVCAYRFGFPISVDVSTDSIRWKSLGDGSFYPELDSLNVSYLPGDNDILNEIGRAHV